MLFFDLCFFLLSSLSEESESLLSLLLSLESRLRFFLLFDVFFSLSLSLCVELKKLLSLSGFDMARPCAP